MWVDGRTRINGIGWLGLFLGRVSRAATEAGTFGGKEGAGLKGQLGVVALRCTVRRQAGNARQPDTNGKRQQAEAKGKSPKVGMARVNAYQI